MFSSSISLNIFFVRSRSSGKNCIIYSRRLSDSFLLIKSVSLVIVIFYCINSISFIIVVRYIAGLGLRLAAPISPTSVDIARVTGPAICRRYSIDIMIVEKIIADGMTGNAAS